MWRLTFIWWSPRRGEKEGGCRHLSIHWGGAFSRTKERWNPQMKGALSEYPIRENMFQDTQQSNRWTQKSEWENLKRKKEACYLQRNQMTASWKTGKNFLDLESGKGKQKSLKLEFGAYCKHSSKMKEKYIIFFIYINPSTCHCPFRFHLHNKFSVENFKMVTSGF